MADFPSLESAFATFVTDWNVKILFSLACGVVLLVVIIRKTKTQFTAAAAAADTNRCTSPSCARCHGEAEIQKKLLRLLEQHVTDDCSVQPQDVATYLSQNYARILSVIDSYDRKTEILSTIYHESGYSNTSTEYFAHVWMMPGLSRSPLWSAEDNAVMKNLFSAFEDPENFESVMQEYKLVSEMEDAWKANTIPTGSWKMYFLMNQGSWVQENVARCPQTLRLLESCGCLMKGTVFGNALFSTLKPGSKIEPHTSPCNFRLRCHLALNASNGFSLRVGKHTTTWQTRHLLVFDDSFVHSVWHKDQEDNQGESDGPVEDRVVLIFDIWHPDINHTEQQALKHLFQCMV